MTGGLDVAGGKSARDAPRAPTTGGDAAQARRAHGEAKIPRRRRRRVPARPRERERRSHPSIHEATYPPPGILARRDETIRPRAPEPSHGGDHDASNAQPDVAATQDPASRPRRRRHHRRGWDRTLGFRTGVEARGRGGEETRALALADIAHLSEDEDDSDAETVAAGEEAVAAAAWASAASALVEADENAEEAA